MPKPQEIVRGADGVDHVNVYAKGQTELGRLLSNFANTPFSAGGLLFRSVEGWWYWRMTGVDRCRFLAGYAAKEFGRTLVPTGLPISKAELLKVYQAKCDQNERVHKLLKENKLRFDHYYIYGDKIVETKWRWTGQLWSEVKV